MPMNPQTHTMVNVVMTHEMKELLKVLADKDHRSMSAEIVYILEKYLKENKEE